eukprot:COSAG01_NODE_5377_length_4298_cov_2.455347_6_plen_127_part_00
MDRETADAFDRAFAVPGARRATLGWCRANIFGGRYRTISLIRITAGNVWDSQTAEMTVSLISERRANIFGGRLGVTAFGPGLVSALPPRLCVPGESRRPAVESPWSQVTGECQRFGHPPRLDNSPL